MCRQEEVEVVWRSDWTGGDTVRFRQTINKTASRRRHWKSVQLNLPFLWPSGEEMCYLWWTAKMDMDGDLNACLIGVSGVVNGD